MNLCLSERRVKFALLHGLLWRRVSLCRDVGSHIAGFGLVELYLEVLHDLVVGIEVLKSDVEGVLVTFNCVCELLL